ncbi:MAG: CHAT domain-containing protein [Ktedonobacteraceae bacterium]
MLHIDQQQTFLQCLCALPLEEGKAYLRAHHIPASEYTRVGEQIKGEALRQWHIDISTSLKLGELLIFFGEYTGHTLSHALGFVAKGDALRMLGHYHAAIECLDIAGEAFLRLGQEVHWARTRMNWGPAMMWLGHIEEALREAEHARSIFLQYNEPYWVCAIDHNIAVMYKRQGRYREACNIYKHIRSVYPSLLDQDEIVIKRAIAMAEANEALLEYLLGGFENAYQLLTQARATFEVLHEVGAVIKVDVHLAELDYIQGYYGSALSRYYQTLDTMLEHKLSNGPMSLAELKLRLVDCLVKLDRAEEACVLADEAVRIYRNIGISLDTGDALREQATALMAFGRPKEALHVLDEAEELFIQGGFDHFASTIRMQRAELQLMLGSPESAYKQAELVKDFSEAQGSIGLSIRASLVMGGALRATASYSQHTQEEQFYILHEARTLCEQATRQARQYNLQEHVYKGQHLLGQIALLQGDTRKAIRCYKVAIAQIERILDNLTHDLSPAFLKTAWSVYEDMIALLLQQGQATDAFGYLEQARSVVLRQYLTKQSMLRNEARQKEYSVASQTKRTAVLRVQQELEEWQQEYRKYSQQFASYTDEMAPFIDKDVIQAALKHCETKISELFERVHLYKLEQQAPFSPTRKSVKNLNRQTRLQHICQQLAPSQIVLSYFLSQEKFVVFLITSVGLSYHELPIKRTQLEHLLMLLPAHLEPLGWSDSRKPPQRAILRLLQKLYTLLLEPIADAIQSYKHIVVVPYGALHTVPFHALHNGTNFLIEHVQVSYLPTSSIIPSLAHVESQLFSGNTDAQTSSKPPLVFGYSGNGLLQRAIEEAKTLAAMIHGRCYLESEATIERLLHESRGSSLIHLATHGHSRLDAPNFSSVLLADGQLNTLDIFSLDLASCELVTLSGCETGLSLSGGGDEQIGLGRAFLAAGASSLVMSLWPVEDAATNILMQFFYRNLLAGESKVQALQNAQCALMKYAPHYAHPYFWAAFRLVGNVGPLRYRES